MSASGVNVLRWSALAFGVFYGFTHQRAITAANKAAADQKVYDHKKQLIEQAKAEYAKKKNPTASTSEKSGLNQDPMDPKFDLEAYLGALMEMK
ncbi:ATP synthase subunit E [Microdochium trichocladiopsis]|uniref:ATP synthase F(0) complex subunit e, mitochondrial n=1 Tax=Microdochium trichocladiopsis TaxID=1682393 RepID=A0A9P9BMP9_9PEZI|nr:ATP synthase subunit E [Microdochium trichocladiopsis]KAH7026500.1 ATP synthase subunit E [Microdochium trichocladiopsis]